LNIQITGLPDNQKIKSINFNIVFSDEYDIESSQTSTTISTSEPKYSIEVPKKQPTHDTISPSPDTTDVIKPEEIDISQRVAKIDPNMLAETF
jgi:hypothetical protein